MESLITEMNSTITNVMKNTWVVQYIFSGLFFIGILSKCWLSSFYTRKIKKTEDMVHTKDKLLKQIILKYESCFKLNGTIGNSDTMIKKYFMKEKKFGMSLNVIRRITDLCKLMTLLLCAVSCSIIFAEGSINRKMLITIAFGIYTILVLELFDRIVDIPHRQEIVFCAVGDYLDNTLTEKLKISQVTSRKEEIEREVKRQAKMQLELEQQDRRIKDSVDKQFKKVLTPGKQKIIAEVLDEYL